MLKILKYFEEYAEEIIVLSLLVYLVMTVNLEVFRRYILNASGAYSEEIARYTIIAIVYLGLPYAMKHKRHIICEVLPSSLSQFTQLCISLSSYFCFILLSIFMIYGTIELVDQQIMLDKRTQAMHIEIWYFSSLIGIGFFLVALRVIQAIIADIRIYKQTGIAYKVSGPIIE